MNDEILARISDRHFRTFRNPADVEALSFNDLLAVCDKIWSREKVNFLEIASRMRSMRSKHQYLKLLYLYDTKIVEREREFNERKGVFTVDKTLRGEELLSAQIVRIDRLHQLCLDLQAELKEDIKLVGDEDRRVLSRKSLYWGMAIALFTFVFSVSVDLYKVLSPSRMTVQICQSASLEGNTQYLQTCDE